MSNQSSKKEETARRGYKEGTIFWREDRKVYEAKVSTGEFDKNGKPKRITKCFKKKTDARKWVNEITNEVDNGTYISPSEMTVSEWLDEWQKTYLMNVKESTKKQYKMICKRITGKLGAVNLQKLTTPMIQRFYNDLMKPQQEKAKDGKSKTVEGLSASGVKITHVVLNEALKQAAQINYIPYNPCASCKLPRVQRTEMNVLSPEDGIPAFLAEIKDKPFENLFKFALFTGLRESEALGLKWSDIDLKTGRITIQRQLKHKNLSDLVEDEEPFDTPKNGKKREIIVSPYVIEVLKKVQKEQAENKLRCGTSYDNEHNLVFTNELGRITSYHTVYHAVKARYEAIGKPGLRFHDLRHSCATLAIANGDDIKTVSENLGHSTTAFTLDRYGHRTEEMMISSADRQQKFIESLGG